MNTLRPLADSGPATQRRISEVLGFSSDDEVPRCVRVERRWRRDGLSGEELSWSVGYGPRTHAWLLRPLGEEQLPAIVALHCHGKFKFYGKEKVADGPDGVAQGARAVRDQYYGGRAYVNELARRGFVVLVHDVFMWGSRRFDESAMPEDIQSRMQQYDDIADGKLREIGRYNVGAADHENIVAKYCNVLGTSLAGVVCHEDRVAVAYLSSRSDVLSDRIGCLGFSGGGARAAFLYATSLRVSAAVIVGMMSGYEELLGQHIAPHTWIFFPPGLAKVADWPDVAACRAPSPLLVQYGREDQMFTVDGMNAADARIGDHYSHYAEPRGYEGRFYDSGHCFSVPMQEEAFAWLALQLGRAGVSGHSGTGQRRA